MRQESTPNARASPAAAADREILELAYWKGLSQSEIAADLEAPLGTVKSRCRRALVSLRGVLGDLTG